MFRVKLYARLHVGSWWASRNQRMMKGFTMMSKEAENIAIKRMNEVRDGLENIGFEICERIGEGSFPRIEMKSRSTSNIHYDSEHHSCVLGDKTVTRSSRNMRQVRSFTQTVWTAYFSHELLKQRKTSTLRDVYYSSQAYDIQFKKQAKSNRIITDLETVTGYPREDFNIFPEERSAVFGDITIQYTVPGYEDKKLALTSHPDGMMIGPALINAHIVSAEADKSDSL